MSSGYNWYTRRNGKVTGPYPAGLVSRYILLGRLSEHDEVSTDNETWAPISSYPELIPQVLRADPTDEIAQERLKAARRWADERGDILNLKEGDERREDISPEQLHLIQRRQQMHEKYEQEQKQKKHRLYLYASVLVITVAVLAPVGVYYASLEKTRAFEVNFKTRAKCDSPPQPGINWRSCKLSGVVASGKDMTGANLNSALLASADFSGTNLANADLGYAELGLALLQNANLSGANMKGADLRGAKLVNTNLQGADLSYADLSGADITGANMANARLDNAIWTGKEKCLPGSTGGCLTR